MRSRGADVDDREGNNALQQRIDRYFRFRQMDCLCVTVTGGSAREETREGLKVDSSDAAVSREKNLMLVKSPSSFLFSRCF